jgi:hypothetical protein
MEMFYSQNFDFKPLKRQIPGLIADRVNKDITTVKREIEKGIRTSRSPVTGQPFAPITETTKEVRALRRQNRKSKNKPLLATGKMSKLIRKNAKARGSSFKGTLTMGREYGAYHNIGYTIKNNFTVSGTTSKIKGKGRFFRVKGKKVPMRLWFGVPSNYKPEVGFRRLLNKMQVALKSGKPIRRTRIGRLVI